MNHRHFLSSLPPVAAIATTVNTREKAVPEPALKFPPYLKEGDTIGICCPSGHISLEEIQPAVKTLKGWGFQVAIGSTVGLKDNTFGGTDEQRIEDMQCMLDDINIKAILFGRGGYGAVRIIDKLDFSSFVKHPKWIAGFSDATVFHAHLSRLKVPSIHCKMCNSFPPDLAASEPEQITSILSIRKALTGEKLTYQAQPHSYNKYGNAEGALVGGNLSVIENLSGTPSDMDTNGKILFIEEVGEYLYQIDRMFQNLKRTGKLKNLKGLIIGGFNRIKPDDPGDEFGHTMYEIITDVVKEYKYPVCFEFPIGHQKYNVALKCGVLHRLTVKIEGVELVE
jgi:muramoyltetrapeptide carboxypeptidase